MAIISIISIIVYVVTQLLLGVSFTMIKNPLKENLVIIQLIVYLIYFIFSDYFFYRTLGKILLKFKIIGFQSNGISRFKQVLIRNLVKLIPIEPFSIFLDEEHRMWHDMASKTTVVDVRKKK
jgi:uncharacterized RDD family membrane protein YckC